MISDGPRLLPPGQILERLRRTIPEELDPRGFVRREIAAKTIFVMLYGFAVEGRDRWIRPTAVTDMSDAQAQRQAGEERERWLDRVQSAKRPSVEGRWYGENTREPIRDETLKRLVELGAVVERAGIATTSPKPRYALARSFARLFDPTLQGEALEAAIEEWRSRHLSSAQLARLALSRKGAGANPDNVLARLPNGEVRRLASGPSADLTRAVIETFAAAFLQRPAVVLVSESARKATYRDEDLLRASGLRLDVAKTLPDVILLDLGSEPPLLVFVECVVSDGEITARRREDLERVATASGYDSSDCAYVTAFADRVRSPFKRVAASLAWGTFAWFQTEPDHLVVYRQGRPRETVSLRQMVE